ECLLDKATREKLQQSRASQLLWTDSITVSSKWRRYDFPAVVDKPGVLLGPPRGTLEGISKGLLPRQVFVAVRGLDATGFWHKLTSPCPARARVASKGENTPPSSEQEKEEIKETVSLLVTSSFAVTDGSGRKIWRARITAPGDRDPYEADKALGPLAFAVLQQQRRTFLQLLYLDNIFAHRRAPFRDSPPGLDNRSPSPAADTATGQQPVEHTEECEVFSPFGDNIAATVSSHSSLRLQGLPFLFWLDLLPASLTQFKGHQVTGGRATLSPSSPIAVVSFPPSRFAKAPEVFLQLRAGGAPALGHTRLLEVTPQSVVVYIHPDHCGSPENITTNPYDEIDWMAWLPI
ncbi:uncharacterized protein LOC34623119, partial [Cyclospora cayetanensis]